MLTTPLLPPPAAPAAPAASQPEPEDPRTQRGMEQLRQRVERLKYENHQLEEMLANAEEQVGCCWAAGAHGGGAYDGAALVGAAGGGAMVMQQPGAGLEMLCVEAVQWDW